MFKHISLFSLLLPFLLQLYVYKIDTVPLMDIFVLILKISVCSAIIGGRELFIVYKYIFYVFFLSSFYIFNNSYYVNRGL